MLIGPEPTTEGFDVYSYAENDNELVGELALSDTRYPFDMLRSFPQSFKNRFRVQETRNESLKGLILIDSPGILSGSKNLNREYDITEVIKNLASVILNSNLVELKLCYHKIGNIYILAYLIWFFICKKIYI